PIWLAPIEEPEMLSVIAGGRDVSRSAERAPFGLEFDRLAVGEITVANSPEWVRAPQHDRRISRGDDFAGDAWMDRQTGTIRYVAVGQSPVGDNPEPAQGGSEPARSHKPEHPRSTRGP